MEGTSAEKDNRNEALQKQPCPSADTSSEARANPDRTGGGATWISNLRFGKASTLVREAKVVEAFPVQELRLSPEMTSVDASENPARTGGGATWGAGFMILGIRVLGFGFGFRVWVSGFGVG